MKKYIGAALAGAAAIAFSTLPGQAQEPLKIGVTATLEGTYTVLGEDGMRGFEVALQEVGQLTLATFANDAGLKPMGSNLFTETEASGAPVVGVPGDPGFATIEQGYLENSNVDPVKEITELIAAQRGYEMNSKVIQAADQMASVVSTGLR